MYATLKKHYPKWLACRTGDARRARSIGRRGARKTTVCYPPVTNEAQGASDEVRNVTRSSSSVESCRGGESNPQIPRKTLEILRVRQAKGTSATDAWAALGGVACAPPTGLRLIMNFFVFLS